MKTGIAKKIVTIVVVLAGILLVSGIALWQIFGDISQTEGPTRDRKPLHIGRVNPEDGEKITEWRGYCVLFHFQKGIGMGHNPESKINAYLDDEDITASLTGAVSLDFPPSYGSYCYTSSVKQSPGWHTARISYSNKINIRFSYTWRFFIDSEEE